MSDGVESGDENEVEPAARASVDSRRAAASRWRERPGSVALPSVSTARSGGKDEASARELLDLIDRDILPVLENVTPSAEGGGHAGITDEDRAALLALLLEQDYAETVASLEALRRRPVPIGALFSDLMAPVARRLGEMWAEDKCSFVEVTVGVSHLKRLVRDLSPLYQSDIPVSRSAGRLLLATVSEEQHTFGLSLLGEVFRRAGWTVTEAPGHSRDELVALVTSQEYDIVGFSLSCTDLATALERDIALVRKHGDAAASRIIIGGPAFSGEPGLVKTSTADGYAPDIHAALALAESLLDEMKGVSPQ